MNRKIRMGALYKINQNTPCLAALYTGDVVRVVTVKDGGLSIGVVNLDGGPEWLVGSNHLDEIILNKGDK